MKRQILPFTLVTLAMLVVFSAASAFAAVNTVPVTRVGQQIQAVTANALKPAECSGINLTQVVICIGGNCDGTTASELILGTVNGERIRGRGGQDCILGGGGDDQWLGNAGTDVCIGGPGNDTFNSCAIRIQ
jgi:hypothetical protein